MKILVVLGTRPEAIKLAPVYLALQTYGNVTTKLLNTGQHRELSSQALEAFSISPDITLDVMRTNQSLGQLTGRLFQTIDEIMDAEHPDWVVVQGDTTTAMVAGLSAFYRRIKLAHVEAGLRSYNVWAPFPEETNRTIISNIATVHFPPTIGASENLLRSGIPHNSITVTGNTVVDALHILRPKLNGILLDSVLNEAALSDLQQLSPILVTSHRRENFGEGVQNICKALISITHEFPHHAIFYPLHPNPQVRDAVSRLLDGIPRVHLLEPLGYLEMLSLMERCVLILTDSGGIQEEAPTFGKPVLILRDVTERPEIVTAGAGILVGTNRHRIVNTTSLVLKNDTLYNKMANAANPFGDGKAAYRVAEYLTTNE
jgi:UDP-N-acetylglucosamine 2-epimerase (non-hydrolysing)